MIARFNIQLTVLMIIGAVGCDSVDDVGEREIQAVSVSHALVQMGSCSDYVSYAKKAARQRMTAIIERNCREMLENANDNGSWGVSKSSDEDVGGAAAPEAAFDGTGESGEFSETNTQEEGVDEADLVKTDGDYIYAISGRDLVVVSIDETGTLAEVGRISLTGRPLELFLYSDVAVVFSGLSQSDVPDDLTLPNPPQASYGGDIPTMAPEMDIDMYYAGSYTGIDIIDLSDRTDPAVIRSSQYAGSYVSSRRIDGAVRVVISSPLAALEVPTWVDVDYWDMSRPRAHQAINRACDSLIKSNQEYLNSLALEDLMPMKLEGTDDQATPITECNEVYGPETPAGLGLLTVVSLDLETPAKVQENVAVMGEEGHVYASESALYLTTSGDYVQMAWESGLWEDETSGIHKFDISSAPERVTYLGSGEATGRLLNQFSLGEHEGYLRVATTTGSAWWGENTLDNHIQIFEESNGKLVLTGALDGIGEGEEIYAARFLGSRGFVVTYLQTDPLFTFDLSDPADPKVVGEWLGPGYSTYLHPYKEDFLIAMGKDEYWRTGVSLYDLSDFSEPTLVERQPLVGEGYESTALYEHKAFTFNPETGELLLPFYDWSNATGVLRYLVTEEDIDLQGTLRMGGDISVEGPARRAMYNGDAIIGVSACRLTSAMRSDPSEVISSIPIWDDACEFPNWYY